MKLFINSASPFARKARIVVREKGLIERVEEVNVIPLESPPALVDVNPIAQIPALTTDDGTPWYDSTLICAWLDAHSDQGPKLLPPMGSDAGEAYWAVRRLEVAGVALTEMIVRMVLENRRPETERSPSWLKRWEDNLLRGFERVEALAPAADVLNMGSLTLGIAATYSDFRYPHIDWRSVAPKTLALKNELEKRTSFVETYPK